MASLRTKCMSSELGNVVAIHTTQTREVEVRSDALLESHLSHTEHIMATRNDILLYRVLHI